MQLNTKKAHLKAGVVLPAEVSLLVVVV